MNDILHKILKNTMSTKMQAAKTDIGNVNSRGLSREVKKLYLLSCVWGEHLAEYMHEI